MNSKAIKISNFKNAYFVTVIIFFVGVVTLVFPLLLSEVFPHSNLMHKLTSYPYYFISIFGAVFLMYFILTGVYFYTLKIDKYIIEVKSKRTVSGFLSKINVIEMPKNTIVKYAFYNRPFTFNTTLMIKYQCSSIFLFISVVFR